jgi:TolB protein
MRRFAAILGVIALSTVALTVAPTHATAPGKNGRIAFRRYLNADHTRGAIFTINPDGTGIRQVTHPRRDRVTTDPDWSPNGRWIAYEVDPLGGDEDTSRLRKIHPNGTGGTSLTGSCTGRCQSENDPKWAPHGNRIAFVRQVRFAPRRWNTFVFVMRADGSHPRQITQRRTDPSVNHHFSDVFPAWSPNANRLAFERADEIEAGGRTNHKAICIVSLGGTGVHRITPWRVDAIQPDWSPNGRWIVFHQDHENTDTSNVWLVHPDGTGLHRVTHDFGGSGEWFGTTFSPNGHKITAAKAPGVGKPGNADVYVMNIDGSGLQNITRSVRWDSTPDWGPRRR